MARWSYIHQKHCQFDFDCKSSSKSIDVQTDETGDISGHFIAYGTEINRQWIGRSFKGTEFLENTPAAVMDQRASFPDSFYCKEKK